VNQLRALWDKVSEKEEFIGNNRVQLEIAKEVVHSLEMARERRQLATHEESIR
jgi:hypothetical protein